MNKRPETGPMKFADDWTGIFIRGDDAFNYALALEVLLKTPAGSEMQDIIGQMTLKGLMELLFSCNESLHQPSDNVEALMVAVAPSEHPKAQLLLGFDDCLKPSEPE